MLGIQVYLNSTPPFGMICAASMLIVSLVFFVTTTYCFARGVPYNAIGCVTSRSHLCSHASRLACAWFSYISSLICHLPSVSQYLGEFFSWAPAFFPWMLADYSFTKDAQRVGEVLFSQARNGSLGELDRDHDGLVDTVQ